MIIISKCYHWLLSIWWAHSLHLFTEFPPHMCTLNFCLIVPSTNLRHTYSFCSILVSVIHTTILPELKLEYGIHFRVLSHACSVRNQILKILPLLTLFSLCLSAPFYSQLLTSFNLEDSIYFLTRLPSSILVILPSILTIQTEGTFWNRNLLMSFM